MLCSIQKNIPFHKTIEWGGHKKPESLSGSVVWGLGFYGWVMSCINLRLFPIVICKVAVVDTIMCWHRSTSTRT